MPGNTLGATGVQNGRRSSAAAILTSSSCLLSSGFCLQIEGASGDRYENNGQAKMGCIGSRVSRPCRHWGGPRGPWKVSTTSSLRPEPAPPQCSPRRAPKPGGEFFWGRLEWLFDPGKRLGKATIFMKTQGLRWNSGNLSLIVCY